MFKHEEIYTQRVAIAISKDGIVTRTLMIETKAESAGLEIDGLVGSVAEYLRTHDLDSAEIKCRKSLSVS